MKYLLDTHLILWAANESKNLSPKMRKILEDENNVLFFSVISVWEISIKSGLGKFDFSVKAETIRQGLLQNGYHELMVNGSHASAAGELPLLHRDPFDRMLITQAKLEGITLLTSDKVVAQYPAPIQLVS